MKTHTRVAIIQMRSDLDKYANLARAKELIAKAASDRAELIGLPEMFNCLGSYDQMFGSAEKIPGDTTNWISELAREYRVYIHGGSIYEKIENSDRVYNTSVIVAPSGDIVAKYQKIHLFDVELPNEFSSCESKWVAPGENVVTLETLFGTLGLSICYDLRFPELFRQLVDKGAQLIFVPSAFRSTTGSAHWEVLLRSRAIENQAYVLAPNQWGEHQGEMSNYGNSMIVNPWGEIIARAGSESDSILAVDVNLEDLERIRSHLPALKHRRIHSS
jgi:predicted amidohydrolase